MFGIRGFNFKINKDFAILGGSAILAALTLVQLHNFKSNLVPTIPGIYNGSGPPATGFYTGSKQPFTPEPYIQPAYESTLAPAVNQGIRAAGQVGPDIQTVRSDVQALWGGFQSSGGVGRGSYRDNWANVYDPQKVSSLVTGDDTTKRLTLA